MLRNCIHNYSYHECFHDKVMALLKLMTIVTDLVFIICALFF